MNLTYDEILNSMKIEFAGEKGEAVKELSDIEARFKAVASEIYSVSAYGDYIMKQSFPQTATSEFLDRHAELRSITRKTASYAKGAITVYRTESSIGSTVSIPKGTIFSEVHPRGYPLPFIFSWCCSTDREITLEISFFSFNISTRLRPSSLRGR